MCTGHIYALKDNNYDLKRWLKEDLIRSFGITASLRDEGPLTEDQIRVHLSSKHNIVKVCKVAKAEKDLEDFKAKSKAEFTKEVEVRRREEKLYSLNKLEALEEEKILGNKALAELLCIASPPEDELQTNILDTAEEQLKLYIKDTTRSIAYYKNLAETPLRSIDEIITSIQTTLVEEIDYQKKRALEEVGTPRHSEIDSYDKFTNFVDRAFKGVK